MEIRIYNVTYVWFNSQSGDWETGTPLPGSRWIRRYLNDPEHAQRTAETINDDIHAHVLALAEAHRYPMIQAERSA